MKLVRDHKFSLSCEHRVLNNEVVERVISNFVNHFRHPVYSFDWIDICSFSLTERLILFNLLHNIVVDEFVRLVDVNHLAIETVHFGNRTHSFLFLWAFALLVLNYDETTGVTNHHGPWILVQVTSDLVVVLVRRNLLSKKDLGLWVMIIKMHLMVIPTLVDGHKWVWFVVFTVINWVVIQNHAVNSIVSELLDDLFC